MRKRINEAHMRNGVTIIDPATTYIESDVSIGQDTIIYPGTMIAGQTVIGEDCLIGPHSKLRIAKLVIKRKFVNQLLILEYWQSSKLVHLLIFDQIQKFMMK